jgi:hypothetical protein
MARGYLYSCRVLHYVPDHGKYIWSTSVTCYRAD